MLAHTEVSRSVCVMYLVPPVAMLMAAVLLGSHVSGGVLFGMAIVLGSVFAMRRAA